MSKWKVHPHGDLQQLAPNLWSVTGSLPPLPLPRNMVIYRLPDRRLVIHSCVCLDDARQKQVEELGEMAFLIVPNEGHRTDAAAYKERYPAMKVLAPRNARGRVEKMVPVDADAEDVLLTLPGMRMHRPDGMKEGYELVYDVDLEGGGRALVVNDVLVCPEAPKRFMEQLMTLTGPPGGLFGQARIVSLFYRKDRDAFRSFVEHLSELPDTRVITTSHGAPVTKDCSDRLRDAITRL